VAKLYFYYSTMNAGKSTSLLQSSHNYRERGMHTLVYTAQLDRRGGGKVHSRIGLASDARHFAPGTSVVSYWTKRSS
jgi:thymidine kinase